MWIPPNQCEKEVAVKDAGQAEIESLRAMLGGKGNIVSAKPVAKTRLLVEVKDVKAVKSGEAAKRGTAVYVPEKGNLVQVLVGLNPERYHSIF
jgi:hypothetical protein